jgi:hypothetical protein
MEHHLSHTQFKQWTKKKVSDSPFIEVTCEISANVLKRDMFKAIMSLMLSLVSPPLISSLLLLLLTIFIVPNLSTTSLTTQP